MGENLNEIENTAAKKGKWKIICVTAGTYVK